MKSLIYESEINILLRNGWHKVGDLLGFMEPTKTVDIVGETWAWSKPGYEQAIFTIWRNKHGNRDFKLEGNKVESKKLENQLELYWFSLAFE